jgi:hypothetical protein
LPKTEFGAIGEAINAGFPCFGFAAIDAPQSCEMSTGRATAKFSCSKLPCSASSAPENEAGGSERTLSDLTKEKRECVDGPALPPTIQKSKFA